MLCHNFVQTAVVTALLCVSPAAAQGPCSQESARGVWAQWAGAGAIITTPSGATQTVTLPAATLGIITIDAQGGTSGWLNTMVAGTYMDLALAGTVEVSPDCTAILRFSLTPQGQLNPLPGQGVTRLFIADTGDDMGGMTVTGILGKSTGTQTWRRMKAGNSAVPRCTYQNIRGIYGTAGDGFVMRSAPGQQPTALPWSQTGKFVIDDAGGITGTTWVSAGGQQMTLPVTAKLQLLDCTGYMTYGAASMDKIIVLDNGDQILDLPITGQGNAVIAVWKRIMKDTTPPGQ
jgi:hypothetical protein